MNQEIKVLHNLQALKENKIYSKYLDKYANKKINADNLHLMLFDVYAAGFVAGHENCLVGLNQVKVSDLVDPNQEMQDMRYDKEPDMDSFDYKTEIQHRQSEAKKLK